MTIQPGDIPLEDIRQIFTLVPANNEETEILDIGIRDLLLDDGGFSEDEVEEYMDFLYTERNRNIGGEWGDTPLNELTPKAGFTTVTNEPLVKVFKDLLDRFDEEAKEMGDPTRDPKAKNTFKDAIKEKVMAKLKSKK